MNRMINILLVDDDEEDFLLVKEIVKEIRNRSYHLDWVSTYEEGIQVMKQQKHDVYLVDYRLGTMIGLDLIQEMLDHGFDAPLILLSGLKDSQIDDAAEKAGAADYLSKAELTPEILDRSIRYCISQYAMLREMKNLNTELESRVAQRTEALASAIEDLAMSQLKLQMALSKEKELNELKSRFVTTASHEFRTPLSAILSSASLIESYVNTEEVDKRKKHVDRIKTSVANLTQILNDFLSLGKLEEGLVRNDPEKIEVVPFTTSVVEELRGILKENQKILYLHDTTSCLVKLDKQLLKNIMINLLSNAIKYSPPGKNIELKTECADNIFNITVMDKGIGIPEEDQPHLFERFFRAKNSINIQGTGLGLNIVKKYVEIMDGDISFTSSVDSGTTFMVRLPVRSQ